MTTYETIPLTFTLENFEEKINKKIKTSLQLVMFKWQMSAHVRKKLCMNEQFGRNRKIIMLLIACLIERFSRNVFRLFQLITSTFILYHIISLFTD